jgi:hypothetical protein
MMIIIIIEGVERIAMRYSFKQGEMVRYGIKAFFFTVNTSQSEYIHRLLIAKKNFFDRKLFVTDYTLWDL